MKKITGLKVVYLLLLMIAQPVTAFALDVRVAKSKAVLQSSDGKPLPCGKFQLHTSVEVFGVYGEHFKLGWQAQILERKMLTTNEKGEAVFEAFTSQDSSTTGLKRRPSYTIRFEGLLPTHNGKCGIPTRENMLLTFAAKNLGTNWTMIPLQPQCDESKGSGKKEGIQLVCETSTTLAQVNKQNRLLTRALEYPQHPDAVAFFDELAKRPKASTVELTRLLAQGNIPVDQICTEVKHSCYPFAPLSSVVFTSLGLSADAKLAVAEKLVQMGSHFTEHDLQLNTPLHHLVHDPDSLPSLRAIEAVLSPDAWSATNTEGQTPLFDAVISDFADMDTLEYILQLPAVVRTINHKNVLGQTVRERFYQLRLRFSPNKPEYVRIDQLLERAGASR